MAKKKSREAAYSDKLEKRVKPWWKEDANCYACDYPLKSGCSSVIQWCHIVSRKQGKRIKFSPMNSVPMCSAHHAFFTPREGMWHDYINRKRRHNFTQFLYDLEREWFNTPNCKPIDAHEYYAEILDDLMSKYESWSEWIESGEGYKEYDGEG